MGAPVEQPILVCGRCHVSIRDEQPVIKRHRPTNRNVAFHEKCLELIKAETEQRDLERKAFAEGRVVAVRASLPGYAVQPDSPEFARRVENPRLRAAALKYMPSTHGSLSLIGPTGCGKSTAASAIVLRLCSHAVGTYDRSAGRDSTALEFAARTMWVTAAELCVARKHHRLGEGEAPLFARATVAPLLVLDEIGQEVADDRWLLELLDARYASSLPTLSTSGLTRVEIEARYGAGTTRRLVEPKGQFIDLFEGATE